MSPAEYLANFGRRILQDALAEATAAYWLRRADTFAAVGTPTADLTARTCRAHAWLLRDTGLDHQTRALIDEILTARENGPA